MLPPTRPLNEMKSAQEQATSTMELLYTAKVVGPALISERITDRFPEAGTPTLYHTSNPLNKPEEEPQGPAAHVLGMEADCVAQAVVPLIMEQTTGAGLPKEIAPAR